MNENQIQPTSRAEIRHREPKLPRYAVYKMKNLLWINRIELGEPALEVGLLENRRE